MILVTPQILLDYLEYMATNHRVYKLQLFSFDYFRENKCLMFLLVQVWAFAQHLDRLEHSRPNSLSLAEFFQRFDRD
jgi:hypothetical protein